MKAKVAVALLTLGLGSACWGQDSQKKSVPSECTKMIRVHGSFPKGPFKFLPKESYKGSPLIKYQIQEGGTVSDAILTRSPGVANIDKKFSMQSRVGNTSRGRSGVASLKPKYP
jgi:hypothetical protein